MVMMIPSMSLFKIHSRLISILYRLFESFKRMIEVDKVVNVYL